MGMWWFGRKSAPDDARPFVPAWLCSSDAAEVVGGRAAGISDPSGGVTVDAEARSAVEQILGTLRQHGLIET
jgi:hypothetical protein